MRRAAHAAGVCLVIASLFYVGRIFVQQFGEILSLDWGFDSLLAIGGGTIAYLCILPALSAAWTFIALAAAPRRPALLAAGRVYARAGIAKYVPGNVFHFVARQVLGRALGIPQWRLLVASGAEIWLSLLSVWVILFASEALWGGTVPELFGRFGFAVGLGALAMVLAMPRIRDRVPRAAPIVSKFIGDAGLREIAIAMALYLGFFLCLALIAGSVLDAMAPGSLPVLQAGAVYLGAWLAGYVVPGASGGIGVREAVLLAHLGGVVGAPVALGFALAMRVQSVVGDVLFFAASYLVPAARSKQQPG